jgi:murein DD-endopeptidase MepM/ murein hydrolase activator NlpD
MQLALVLSVSTLACATWGGSSAVSERENCAWQVCVRSRDGRTGRTYYVDNAGPVPATVTLTFRSFRNLRPPIRSPGERVVAAESTMTLAHLDVVVRGARMGAEASITIDLGASDTEPDEEFLYGIPFGGEAPRRLIQGFDGTETHREGMRYALDFAMPKGTPIVAARGGTVVHVQDGFEKGGADPELLQRANIVVVAHGDGTVASYGHLSSGLPVSVGDSVAEGDLIAYSGATGFVGQPHLHFHVGVRLLADPGRTILIRLKDSNGYPVDLAEGSAFEPAQMGDR